jgi:hypothetical protein
MKLLIMQFSPKSYYFIPLRAKYSLQHPVPSTLNSSIGVSTGWPTTTINLVAIDISIWTEINEEDVYCTSLAPSSGRMHTFVL